ncbi:CHASE2 domain-containing protein [uncultured Desulfobulbus sp.]|uniref:CHASE2 domain-containing protein n=1 Tax=uncultured Desulfobulbus sp. TaxID=239745 RepID=UPI0029C60A5F|nr:CHASE2 domain-containing protein [uncultured Desulfobulbus sp.]
MIKRLPAPFVGLLLIGLLHLGGLLAGFGNDGLDLLFRLRGPRPPDQRLVLIGVDEPSLQQLGAWPFPRRLHAELLGHLRQARAVGFDVLFPEPTDDDALFSRALESGPPVILAITHERDGRLLRPAGSIAGYKGTGHIETILAGDGIVRRVDLNADPAQSAFSLSLLRAAAISLPDLAAPSRLFINYYGPEETFLFLSYAEVLAGRYPPDFFRDRLVLIGAQAVGLGDSHITSFTREQATPGVEIQATIINNLLDHSFIHPLPLLPWLLIGLTCLVAGTAWPTCGERVNLLINTTLLLAVFAGAWLLFQQNLFYDFPQVLLFFFFAYLIHLVQQLLRAANRILVEARRLDQELDAGLHLVAGAIPEQYLRAATNANPLTSSALQRHLDRLQAAANALSLQHHFLENLLKEELPPLILWEDTSGRAVFANSAFARFWQEFAPMDLGLPTCQHFLDAITGSAATTTPDDDNHVAAGEPVNIELLGTNGRRFYQAELHPLLVPDTGFRGVLAVLQDITGIKELEQVKDEVLAIVSHQLKLPLTTILGYGEILTDALSGEHQLYAQEIYGQSRRLNRMIEDFLDIARLESGRKQIRRFPFPLGRMIEDAITTVQPAAQKKSIDIIAHQPSRTTPLLGDESLLLQAMINLLDNAVKFSPERTTVTVEMEEQPQQFVLRVIDQGPGIAREERQRIFDKFQRGNHPAKADGFGLGLHLVKQIVDRHHGSIAVLDGDEGAVFQIILPKLDQTVGDAGAFPCA